MSFSVYVGEDWFNYTSNMGAFFAFALQGVDHPNPPARNDSRDAIFGARYSDGLIVLNGVRADEAVFMIERAFDRIDQEHMAATRGGLKRFDSPNGWGSVLGATLFLLRIHRACTRHAFRYGDGGELEGEAEMPRLCVSL